MVRAVIHQQTGNGFFINPSSGIFAQGNFNVGLNETENNSAINIYPNPSSGKFNISSNEKIRYAEITNLLGEKIPFIISNTNNTEIDLSKESKGIYFCKIKTENNIEIRKLL